MKRVLIWMLTSLTVASMAFAEPNRQMDLLDLSVSLSQTEFTDPQEVEVNISVYNRSAEDRPGWLMLYYPDGTQITEFGSPTLKAGEQRSWTGTWFVTQNQLNAGKVRFGVQYTGMDTLGNPVTKEGYVTAGIISLPTGKEPASPVLVMSSNPSTGFDWSWEIDNEAVVSVNTEYVSDMIYNVPDIIPVVGGGGRTRIQLTGLTPGEATVIFTYKRVWETKTPLYTLVYRVSVDEELNVTILSNRFDW